MLGHVKLVLSFNEYLIKKMQRLPIVSTFVKAKLLQPEEIVCSICLEIYLSPVTLPCNHTFCLSCLRLTLQSQSQPKSCPMCRYAIDDFVPKNTILESLVNFSLLNQMIEQFPLAVQKRALGLEDGLSDLAFSSQTEKMPISYEPGSIRKEYELEMQTEEQERKKKKISDEKQSLILLEQILIEDIRVSNAPKPILEQLRGVRKNLEDLIAKEAIANTQLLNNEQPSTSSGVPNPALPPLSLISIPEITIVDLTGGVIEVPLPQNMPRTTQSISSRKRRTSTTTSVPNTTPKIVKHGYSLRSRK